MAKDRPSPYGLWTVIDVRRGTGEKKCSEPRGHGEGQALATGCGRLLMSDEEQVSLTLRLERLLPTYRVNIRRGELLVRNAHPYQQISDNNIC